MSSALDGDTMQAFGEAADTVRAMLRSAQKDLQKVFIVFLIGFLGTFYALRLFIWDFLRGVTESQMRAEVGDSFEVIAQTPFDVILLQAKIGLIVGIIVAVPIFLYFSRSALRDRGLWPQAPIPRWKLATIVALSLVLFAGGAAYAYAVFFPVMFGFLAGFGFDAGLNPSYSIVMWTEFIVLLTISFGLAAQMPLLITGLSYTEIVPYETFRDKWRHAIVGMFVFGAFFSPPDPFTQIMWAFPLIVLYGLSLYLAKIVVTTKRGSEQINVPRTVRAHWNSLAGAFVAGLALVYGFYTSLGVERANQVFVAIRSDYRLLPAGEGLGVDPMVAIALYGTIAGIVLALLALAFFLYTSLESVGPDGTPIDAGAESDLGEPTALDLSTLDAAGIRAAPDEAFIELDEPEAMELASTAIENDDPETARAVLDRFDETEAARQAAADDAADGDSEPAPDDETTAGTDTDGDLGDRASRAGDSFLEELTDGERDTDDIGGYYTDIMFIIGTLRSRSFRLVLTFLIFMAGTFTWFYLGGLGTARENFLSRMPPELVDEATLSIITLHPVEAVLFIVKFSVLIGVLAVFPMVAYYAWPALRELGFVRGNQNVIFLWTSALSVGLVGGFVLGYLYIAPAIISFLVADAVAADMLITYRINDFFWLIIFTTAGIGILADIPVLMILLNKAGVPYAAMRNRWREVTMALLTVGALFTPADIITMFLVTVPLMIAYGIGLAVLFLITAGGRRNLSPPSEFVT